MAVSPETDNVRMKPSDVSKVKILRLKCKRAVLGCWQGHRSVGLRLNGSYGVASRHRADVHEAACLPIPEEDELLLS